MRKRKKLLLLLATGIMLSAFSFPMAEAKERVQVASDSNAERREEEEDNEIVTEMAEIAEDMQRSAEAPLQEGNEFAAIQDLKLDIFSPVFNEITVGELPKSIRVFVFGDVYGCGNTQETLKEIRTQLKGIDTDVYYLDIKNRTYDEIISGAEEAQVKNSCYLCMDQDSTYNKTLFQLIEGSTIKMPAVFVVGEADETIYLKTFDKGPGTVNAFVQEIKVSILEEYPDEAEVNEQGQRVVYAGTSEEFLAALRSDTKIILEGKTYNVGGKVTIDTGDGTSITVDDVGLLLHGLDNVTIQGQEGTRVISNDGSDIIFYIVNSSNIVLDSLVIGHDLPQRPYWECDINVGVVSMKHSSNVTINNCDIFGCGWYGIQGAYTSLMVTDTIIRDCTSHIMEILNDGQQSVFKNCEFYGNGYAKPFVAAVQYDGEAENLIFEDCEFKDNNNPNFCGTVRGYWGETEDGDYVYHEYEEPIFFNPTVRNCTFSGNGWDDGEDSSKWIKSITITPSEMTLKVGDKKTLSKTIAPEDADNLSVTWSSTDTSVATVDNEGTVTAISNGTAEVYCTAQDAGKVVSNSCKVIVQSTTDTSGDGEEKPGDNPSDTPGDEQENPENKRIESISITPEEITLNVGSKKTLSKTTVPSEGVDNSSVTWHSTNTSVATVDNQGTITAIAKGNAEIYCTSQDGGNVESNHCKVQVVVPSSSGSSGGSSGGSGGSSGGSGGGGGGSTSKSTSSSQTARPISISLPSYVVKGTWTLAADGTWHFASSAGIVYANVWAAVENPYANLAAGQQTFDWFRFNENGNMLIGWYYDAAEGFWYYLNPISDNTLGKMMTGWVMIDGSYYYFNEISDGYRGRMYRNEITPDGYWVDANGVWVENKAVQVQ